MDESIEKLTLSNPWLKPWANSIKQAAKNA